MQKTFHHVAAILRAPLAHENRFAAGLLAMVALRVLMVALLMADVPHLDGHVPPWYFHTGGDQHNYFNLAVHLARGTTAEEKISLGTALMMVPLVWLANPSGYRDIVAPLVVVNGLLFGGASVALVGLIGRNYTGDRRVGLLAAALWLLLPVFIYAGLSLHPAAELLRGSILPKIMWLTGVSDGQASFGILVGVWALSRAIARGGPRDYFLTGLAFGWAVMVRIQVAPVVGFLLGVLLLMRAWRGLLWVSVGGLLGYLPQAILNTVEFGIPLYTGYLRVVGACPPSCGARWSLAEIRAGLPYSPGAFVSSLSYFTDRYPWLAAPLMVAALGLLAVLVVLWRRRGWPHALILLGVPTTHILTSVAVFFFPDDPIRHSMLAYPYLLIVGTYAACLLWEVSFDGWRRRLPARSVGPDAGGP